MGAPAAPPAAQQAQPVTGAKEWTGLATFPAATQKALADILGNLREKVRESAARNKNQQRLFPWVA